MRSATYESIGFDRFVIGSTRRSDWSSRIERQKHDADRLMCRIKCIHYAHITYIIFSPELCARRLFGMRTSPGPWFKQNGVNGRRYLFIVLWNNQVNLFKMRMALLQNNSSKCLEGLEDSFSALLFSILNRFRLITLTAGREGFGAISSTQISST